MGHFYDELGKPAYQVLDASGKKMIDTTLRQARKLGLYKSVTTVTDQLAKFGLDKWKIDQIGNAIKEYPFDPTTDDMETYWKSMVKVSGRISEETRDTGQKVHKALENYYITGELDSEHEGFCRPVIELIKKEIGDYQWVPEKSFTYITYGGCVDLHTTEGDGIVLDFKTKNKDNKKDMKGYDEHLMQLAAYRNGLKLPKARCFDAWISTKVKGLIVLQEWSEEDLSKGWDMFQCLNMFYDLKNGYFPEEIK